MKSFLVDQDGYYGEFGGAYVPEILHKCVEELTNKYLEVIESEELLCHGRNHSRQPGFHILCYQ